MKIRKLLLLIATVFSLSAMAEDVTTDLVVWSKDGTKVSYKLNDSPKITFTDESLVITTNRVEVNYNLSQMARITYEKTDLTGIVNVNGDKVSPCNCNGESLLFLASNADTTVKIYTADGKLILSRNVLKGDTVAVSLSSLNSGIYLTCVNGITYKIAVR